MIKKIALFLFVIGYNLNSQNTVGTLNLGNEAFEGYTLFTVNTKSFLINNCGEVMNEWNSDYLPGNAVYLLENGNLLRAGRLEDDSSPINFGGTGGIVELFDWENNLLWSFTYSSNEHRQHHDVYPLPNGNVLILAATVMTGSEAIQAGRNPNLLEDEELYNEQIIEVEPVGENQVNLVWEWNVKDHLIQDFDSSKDNFGNVGENPQLLDINFTNGNSGSNNWLHINSIQYNEDRDQIVISSRNLSEIWIIDHSTSIAEAASNSGGTYGKGGDLLYRWGNPQSYRQGSLSDQKLFGQHYPHFIPSGNPNENKIIVFNNGIGRNPSFSQVDIITPPEVNTGVFDYTPNTSFNPSSPDFTYFDLSNDPSEFYSAIVSSAQQLPNGNILICEGREGYFFEIKPNGDKVWEYINPVSNADGNSTPQNQPPPPTNLTFRAIKYGLDYQAFEGRDLTPGNPIELEPDLSVCANLNTASFETSSVSIYPNPTSSIITIKSVEQIEKIELYSVTGRKVDDYKPSETINLSGLKAGIYILKISTGEKSISKKVVKI